MQPEFVKSILVQRERVERVADGDEQVLLSVGATGDARIVAALPGSGAGAPLFRMLFTQFTVVPNFAETTGSPVIRSSVKYMPLRDAVRTSLRGWPSTMPSMSTGVCAES